MHPAIPLTVSLMSVLLNVWSARAECPAGCGVPTPAKKVILHGVGFDSSTARIRGEAVPILDEAAEILAPDDQIMVIIDQSVGDRGSEAFRRVLERRRAKAVRRYLVNRGVAARSITVDTVPVPRSAARNATTPDRGQPLRVELHVN